MFFSHWCVIMGGSRNVNEEEGSKDVNPFMI